MLRYHVNLINELIYILLFHEDYFSIAMIEEKLREVETVIDI